MVRRYQVEDGHPRQCRQPDCNWVRVSVDPSLCSKHLGQWKRGSLGEPDGAYRKRNDPNWLPEDGVFDPIAVDIAALGLRVVRMTDAERMAAAKRILAQGGNSGTLMTRIGITNSQAVHLMHRTREAGIAEQAA